MTQQTCDQKVAAVLTFLKQNMPKELMTKYSASQTAREESAPKILEQYSTNPEFSEKLRQLSEDSRAQVSVIREALLQHYQGRSATAPTTRPVASSMRELVGA